MPLVRRTILFAVLAASALVAGTSTASAAITVSNPGTLTLSDSGNVQWNTSVYGFPETITCSTSNLTASVSSSGAFTVSAATHAGCSDGIGGSVTITATALPWTAQIKGSAGAYRLDALPVRQLWTPSFGGTCAYNGGTVTTVAKASPLTQLSYSAAGPLTSTTAGCGSTTWTGDYNLSRSLSISGSL